jgi:N-acetylneuraminic acid mutarotase
MEKRKLLPPSWQSVRNILAILLFTAFLSGLKAQNLTWTDMPPLPHTLYAPASFTIGNDIYVVSGVAVSEYLTGFPVIMSHEVWGFNTVSNTWTQKGNFPGTAVYEPSAFTIGNYGYVVNGWDSTGSNQGSPNNTWQYDPTNDTWTAKAPFPGFTRYTAASFAINNKGYVACGFAPYVNDVWCYDPSVDSWSQKSNFPGSPRQAMEFFTIGNTAYAGMGATSDGMGSYFVQSDWYKYDGTTDTWTQLNPFPGDALDGAFSFMLNGYGYLIDGMDQSSIYYSNSIAASKKVWQYNPSTDNWSLWGLFPDSALFSGAFGQANGAGFMGFGAKNYNTLPYSRKFYRLGPGTAPYSCNITIGQYEISNAVYNFQANGNFSPTAQITWNFGDGHTGAGTSVIHNYTTVGHYNVSVNVNDTASSCSNNASDSVFVSNINNCSVAVNSTNFGTTTTLSTSVTQGAGPYTYQWSCSSDSTFSSTSPDPVVNIALNTPTTYCVTVTDTTGCVASACKTVVDSQTLYTPCQVYIVVYPDSAVPGYYYAIIYVASSGPLNFLWNFGDGTTSTQEFPSHTYAQPGIYTLCLTVSDGSGCNFTFCDSSFYAYKYGGGPMVHLNVRGQVVLGINGVTNNLNVNVYPNPANAEIIMDAAGQKIDNAIIYDAAGQTVMSVASPVQNKMDVSKLSNGMYIIEVKVQGTSTRVKFVKTN